MLRPGREGAPSPFLAALDPCRARPEDPGQAEDDAALEKDEQAALGLE